MLFIQMQLCERSLHDYLRQRNYCTPDGDPVELDAADELRTFRQVVSGVDYIHSLGLIHRDIKVSSLTRVHADVLSSLTISCYKTYHKTAW